MASPAQPSQKTFISDLHSYEIYRPMGNSNNKMWLPRSSSLPNRPLKFIWLQGDIVQCDCADTFVLDDGTGLALIGGCCKVHPVCPKPRKGGYFMVIGKLMAIDNIPAVKAYKLQDLSGEKNLRDMWTMEVLDTRHLQS